MRPPDFVSPRVRFGHDARSGRVPLNRVQLRAGAALVDSKRNAAHAYAISMADYSGIEAVRERFELTYLPFVARAVALALRDHPALNATIVDGEVVPHRAVHLGIAVDLSHQGLVVPVLRDADQRTVGGFAVAARDLARRARAKQLGPDDLSGATFTITNPGGYGTHWSFPIINRPQVAILSTDGVRKRVVVDRASHGLAIAPIGALGLAFDATAVRADEAGRFVERVASLLASIEWETQI